MAETPKPSGSLSDRISQPPVTTLKASTTEFKPSSTSSAMGSWADEVASPVAGTPQDTTSDLATAQMDGAAVEMQGSQLHDGEHEVEVKLSQLQADSESPLFSIQSFDQLGM
jgi:ATP-dependent RNA helicase DDX19/DBP5